MRIRLPPAARRFLARPPASPDPECPTRPIACRPAHPEWLAACCDGSVWKPSRRSADRRPTSGRWHGRSQRRTSQHLTAERLRMDHRAHIGIGQEIDDMILASFYIRFDLGKTGDVGKCYAIVRIVVLRRGPSPWPASAATDALVIWFRSAGVRGLVDAAELNRAVEQPAPASCRSAPLRKTRSFATSYLPACRRGSWRRFPAVSAGFHRGRIGGACHRVGGLAAAGTQVYGDSCRCRPRRYRTSPKATPRTSAPARWTSITFSVPRFPIPDWKVMRPSGLMTRSPSNPVVPPT